MVKLSEKAPGEIIKLNVDGSPINFVVVAQNYEPSLNSVGNTAVLGLVKDIKTAWKSSTYAGIWSQSDAYSTLQQFINRLDPDIQNKVMNATYRTNLRGDNGTTTTTSKIFTVSAKEMGANLGTDVNSLGTTFLNIETITEVYLKHFPVENLDRNWTRQSLYDNTEQALERAVNFYSARLNGVFSLKAVGSSADNIKTVLPMFLLPNDLNVLDDGTITVNEPPTTPLSISFGTPKSGKPLQIACEESTDPEGNLITYVFERQIDNNGWNQITSDGSNIVTDTVPYTGTNYNARVKAVDENGAESDYCVGEAKAIVYNQPPYAPDSITFSQPYFDSTINIECSLSEDPDGDSFTYIWEKCYNDSEQWDKINETEVNNTTDKIPNNITKYNVRVKVLDSKGNSSDYCTGISKSVLKPVFKYKINASEKNTEIRFISLKDYDPNDSYELNGKEIEVFDLDGNKIQYGWSADVPVRFILSEDKTKAYANIIYK